MDKYLLEILKEVNTIIIPGLGALTITNKETGEIMFMAYLKHDDGKLSSYIAEKEGWEEIEAKNLISKYVREIIAQIGKGESYDMYQFGSFFKDGDDIDFKNWNKDSGEQEQKPEVKAASVEPISDKDKDAHVTQESVKPTVAEENSPETKSVKEDIVPPVEQEIPKAEAPTTEVKESAPEKITPPISKEETELNILEKEERKAVKDKLEKLKEVQENKPSRKKKGAGFWILIILIGLIVGGGTYVGINYDSFKEHIPFLADTDDVTEDETHLDEMKEILGDTGEDPSNGEMDSEELDAVDEEGNDNEEGIDEDILDQDVPAEEPLVAEEIVEDPVIPQSALNGSFHLVAGAFSSEENANRLVEKLKSEGYPAQVLPGNMYIVSVKSFATRAEANAGKQDVANVAPKAWVLER